MHDDTNIRAPTLPIRLGDHQVVLYRQKYDPNRRESVVIDIPNGL